MGFGFLHSLSLKVNPMVDAYVLNRVDKPGLVCLIFFLKKGCDPKGLVKDIIWLVD
jgi:hypothetical protein